MSESDFHDNIVQKNLINITCAYIRDISSQNVLEPFNESSKSVVGLLVCLENVFCHSLKGSSTWSKNGKIWHWIYQVCYHFRQNHIDLINNLDNLRTSLSKFRTLLRLALQSKELHFYIDIFLSSNVHLRKYYHPNSVLFANEINQIKVATVELQYADFCFDIRSEDLNFAGLRQIDYTPYIRTDFRPVCISLEDEKNSTLNTECPKCQEYAQNLKMHCSQKKYLEETLTKMNAQLTDSRQNTSKLAHANQVLRSAFDQLQTNFVLLHEEYLQELRQFGIDSKLGVVNARVALHNGSLSRQSTPNSTNASAVGCEMTEETDLVDLLSRDHADIISIGKEATYIFSLPSEHNSPPLQSQNSAPPDIGLTNIPMVALPALIIPLPQSPVITKEAKIGEQSFVQGHEKYRLPDCEDLSPNPDEAPYNIAHWTVDVKPKQTNFRCRYALPNTSVRRVNTPRPCQDLFSELQQTDSSFHFAYSHGSPLSSSEATSDQISEIALDVCHTSTSGVTTSTATIMALEEKNGEGLFSAENIHTRCTRSADDDCRDYYTLTSPSEGEPNSETFLPKSVEIKPKSSSTPKILSNYARS